MTTDQVLVQRFGDRSTELDALRGLTGGVTATHLRATRLTDAAFDAVAEGLSHENPRVRWWCIQVLDHVPDERALDAVATMLDDPVPRVRRNAVHALGCLACKPGSTCELPTETVSKLTTMANDDPNPKVRAEASYALARRSV